MMKMTNNAVTSATVFLRNNAAIYLVAATCILMPFFNRISVLLLVLTFTIYMTFEVWIDGRRKVWPYLLRVRNAYHMDKAFFLTLFYLLILILISVSYAVKPLESAKAALSLVALFIIGYTCINTLRIRITLHGALVLTISFVVSICFAGLGLIDIGPSILSRSHSLNRPIVFITLVFWLVAFYSVEIFGTSRGGWLSALLGFCVFFLAIVSESQSAVIGFVAGIFGFSIAVLFGKKGIFIVTLVSVAVLTCFPFIVSNLDYNYITKLINPEFLNRGSAAIRLQIWEQYTLAIYLKPISGWGFYSSRFIPVDSILIAFPGATTEMFKYPHPHSLSVQIWVELGILGVIGFAVLLILFAIRLMHLQAKHQAFGLAILCTSLSVSMISHGFFQNWWLACLIILALSFPKDSKITR